MASILYIQYYPSISCAYAVECISVRWCKMGATPQRIRLGEYPYRNLILEGAGLRLENEVNYLDI